MQVVVVLASFFVSLSFLGARVQRHEGRVDVHLQLLGSINSTEVFQSDSLLDSDFSGEESDGFSSEINFDGEAVGGGGNVGGLDGDESVESFHDGNFKNSIAAVLAIHS